MANPVIEEVTQTTDTVNNTSAIGNFGATVNAGDLLILICIIDSDNTIGTPSDAAGGTWVAGVSQRDSSPASRISTFAKVAIGSEGGSTVTMTTGGNAECCIQIYRIRTGTWYGAVANGVFSVISASNTNNSPNNDPAIGAKDYMAIAFAGDSNFVISGTPSLTNYTNVTNQNNNESGAGQPGLVTARRALTAASSEDPGAWTADKTNYGGVILIRPAEAVSVTPGVASLTLSAFAPKSVTGFNPTPGTASLVTALKTIAAGLAVIPAKLSLTLTAYGIVTVGAHLQPKVVDVETSEFGSASTSHLVEMPATVLQGELLFFVIEVGGVGANDPMTTPSGWTLLGTSTDTVPDSRIAAYAKVADGTEDGTTVDVVTTASVTGVAQCYRINQWEGTIGAVQAAFTGSGTGDPPALTPTWGEDNTLWVAFEADANDADTGAASAPANYTGLISNHIGAALDPKTWMSSAWRGRTIATEDPGAFGTTANFGVTVGIHSSIVDPKTVIPGAASLALDAKTPSVRTDVFARPDTGALVTARFAPTVLAPRLVVPGTAALVTAQFAPIISRGLVIGNAALVLAAQLPLVKTPWKGRPGVLTVTTTRYAPSVLRPKVAAPGVASLVTQRYAPAARTGQAIVPDIGELVLTAFDIVIVQGTGASPGTASLVTAQFAPTVLAPRLLVPGTVSLVTARFPISITPGNPFRPGTASLVLSPKFPTVFVIATSLARPGVARLRTHRFQIKVVITSDVDGPRPTYELEFNDADIDEMLAFVATHPNLAFVADNGDDLDWNHSDDHEHLAYVQDGHL